LPALALLIPLAELPRLNAFLNGASAILLLTGYTFIRAGRVLQHKICMLSAFACSACFLASYVYFHYHAGLFRFSGQGTIRPVYFTILISHTILAIVIVPLVLITLTFALRSRFLRHRAIARWTLPLWLYVSITGVIVYYLLFVLYKPIGSGRGL
jgi:putative membrane protein